MPARQGAAVEDSPYRMAAPAPARCPPPDAGPTRGHPRWQDLPPMPHAPLKAPGPLHTL